MFLIDCVAKLFYLFISLVNRIRLRWYIEQLKNVKQNQADRGKGYTQSPEEQFFYFLYEHSCYLVSLLFWPISFCCSICGTQSHRDGSVLYIREPANYLSLVTTSNTKENKLLKQSLIYLYGTLFSILFFYSQVFFLARFDWVSLVFVLVILVVCTFGPMLSESYGLAVSLLVIPVSVPCTIRACVYAVILFEMQLLAWGNINTNLDSAFEAISCDKRVFSEFWGKIDFRFDENSEKKQKSDRITVNLNPESNVWFVIISKVEWMQITFKQLYRRIVYLLNGLVDLKKTVMRWVRRVVNDTFTDISFDILKFNITIKLHWLAELVEKILIILEQYNPIEVATNTLVNAGKMIIQIFKDAFSVKCQKNYQFKVNSSNNVSFSIILGNVKNHLLEKHTYLSLLQRLLLWLIGLYVMQAFIRIFGGAIFYLVAYLNLSCYDNWYITEQLLQLDQRMQRQSVPSLFPLCLFEQRLYVRPGELSLCAVELAQLSYALVGDMYLAMYVCTLLTFDYGAYRLCSALRHWTLTIAHHLSHSGSEAWMQSSYVRQYLWDKHISLDSELEALSDQVSQCAPTDVPPEYDMYGKCGYLVIILLVTSLVQPYLLRTRSYLCGRLFSDRLQARARYLYTFIKYSRMVVRTLVKTFCPPGVEKVLFMKVGPANLPVMSVGDPLIEDEPKVFFLFKIWPFNVLAQITGIIQSPKKCRICNKSNGQSNFDMIKCPNLKCNSFYCSECSGQLRKRCLTCNTIIYTGANDESFSEEKDSSDDEL